jgi:DNA-binding PadR family transcriptional regulator
MRELIIEHIARRRYPMSSLAIYEALLGDYGSVDRRVVYAALKSLREQGKIVVARREPTGIGSQPRLFYSLGCQPPPLSCEL